MAETRVEWEARMESELAAREAWDPGSPEHNLDAASARRVVSALRREQAARDGRELSRAWKRLADRVERYYREVR